MIPNLVTKKDKLINLIISLSIIIHPLFFINIRALTSKYNTFLVDDTKIQISNFLEFFFNLNFFNIRFNIMNNFPPFFYIAIISIFFYYLLFNIETIKKIRLSLNIKLFLFFFALLIFYISIWTLVLNFSSTYSVFIKEILSQDINATDQLRKISYLNFNIIKLLITFFVFFGMFYIFNIWSIERILHLLSTIFYVSFFIFICLFVIYIFIFKSTFIGISLLFVTRAEKNAYAVNLLFLLPIAFYVLNLNNKRFILNIINKLILCFFVTFAILIAARQIWFSLFLGFIIVSIIKWRSYKISYKILTNSLITIIIFLLICINLPRHLHTQEWWIKLYNTFNLNEIVLNKLEDNEITEEEFKQKINQCKQTLDITEVYTRLNCLLLKTGEYINTSFLMFTDTYKLSETITVKENVKIGTKEKQINSVDQNESIYNKSLQKNEEEQIVLVDEEQIVLVDEEQIVLIDEEPIVLEDKLISKNKERTEKEIFSKNKRNQLIRKCYDIYVSRQNYLIGSGPYSCPNSHNEYVNILTSYGILGFILFSIILITILKSVYGFEIIKFRNSKKMESLNFLLLWSTISLIINLYFAQMFFSTSFITYMAINIAINQKIR